MSRLARQSFLGSQSGQILASSTVGIIGLGGGGSHVVQQLSHLGIGNFVLCDPDFISSTNTNRLVGGTLNDVKAMVLKIDIARRIISGLEPTAAVSAFAADWKNHLTHLRACDIIVSAVDSLKEKADIEKFCRRYLIPLIDIGMTITRTPDGYLISGQVIRSSNGMPCFRCLGFLTDDKIAREEARYGDSGDNPQVVWSNGVLASAAVGMAVRQLTPWNSGESNSYLVYDGNAGTVTRSKILEEIIETRCAHHPY